MTVGVNGCNGSKALASSVGVFARQEIVVNVEMREEILEFILNVN